MQQHKPQPAARNADYQRRVLAAPYEICIERARYVTRAYRQTAGQHPSLRAARALERTLREMSIYILDCEQIVGNRTSKLVGTSIPVERGDINTVLELDLDALQRRPRQPFLIDADDKEELLKEILPYWKERSMRFHKKRLWEQRGINIAPSLSPMATFRRLRSLGLRLVKNLAHNVNPNPAYLLRAMREVSFNNPAVVTNVFDDQGHLVLGHRNVIHSGFAALAAQARGRLDRCNEEGDRDGAAFCEAVLICCRAIRDFAARFADLARDQAERTADAARRDELRAIAERCDRVPHLPPRDFREAVQSLWLTQCGALVAYGMGGIFAIGRADQYLYRYYRRDLDRGLITRDQALELIEELLIKLSYNLILLPAVGKNTGSELGADNQAVTVGGVDPRGEDATNELSYVFVDAVTNLRGTANSFSVRVSGESPDAWIGSVAAMYAATSGPAVFNDDVIIKALEGCGYSSEDARDYAIIGCVEPTADGNTFGCTSGNDISLTGALEMALFRGRLWIVGRRVGPDCGDPRAFCRFEQLMDAFKRQVVFLIDLVVEAVNLKDDAYAAGFHNPYVSSLIDGCIDSARDMTRGGARHNFSSVSARGLGTAADALAAIKTVVYQREQCSMQRLLDALRCNFRGQEPLRQRLLRQAPKFGCDDDTADAIAKEVAEFFCREVAARRGRRGGVFRPSFFSYGMHVLEGGFLGASANGRRAGEPVSNSLSPSNGVERNGPTAMLRSVAKIDHSLISNGCSVNIKLLPSTIDSAEGQRKLGGLIRGYFAMGGMEIQPNVVDPAMLRDAQLHPDRYPGLVVRVSGYSAYFTDLGKEIQDEIIARTTF